MMSSDSVSISDGSGFHRTWDGNKVARGSDVHIMRNGVRREE